MARGRAGEPRGGRVHRGCFNVHGAIVAQRIRIHYPQGALPHNYDVKILAQKGPGSALLPQQVAKTDTLAGIAVRYNVPVSLFGSRFEPPAEPCRTHAAF